VCVCLCAGHKSSVFVDIRSPCKAIEQLAVPQLALGPKTKTIFIETFFKY